MKYGVNIPVAGYMYLEVEAENKKEAIDNAIEKSGDLSLEEWNEAIVEMDTYKRLVQGNICYVYHCEADAEEIEDEE